MPVNSQGRVNEISTQFAGAGWKNLPQELVDEILGYLLDDLDSLKACSLTSKCLLGATRPLIHRRLVCLRLRPEGPEPKTSLFSRRKRDPGAFGRLVEADHSGVLRYTQHLTIKLEDHSLSARDMQEYLPHLRSITKLHTLTLNTIHLHLFVPVFNKHFGMFTNTLRHLDIRSAYGMEPQLLYIISQIHLLEDLTIVYSAGGSTAPHGHPVPMVTQSPPLRGKLVVAQVLFGELFDGLAAFPGGLNFSSLELRRCRHPEVIFARCGHTATSISYLWSWGDVPCESNPLHSHVYCDVTIGTIANSLDLRRCVVLERFEFNTMLSNLWQVGGWILRTLRTVTSAPFNEFVIWILDEEYPWSLRYPLLSDNSWGSVDVLLNELAEHNPDFRVVFRGDFDSFRCSIGGEHDEVGSLVKSHLPLVSSKCLVKFEQVRHVENRFRKSGIL